MRIALLNLTGGGMSGGYRKYLAHVLPRIAAHQAVDAVLCASPAAMNIEGLLGPVPRVEFMNADRGLRSGLERFSPDVIFIPVERYFRFKAVPVVTMVQNMEPLAGAGADNPFFERVQHFLRALLAKQGIQKADRVIAISEFVKEYIIRSCNVPADKVGLIYYGIDERDIGGCSRPASLPDGWDGDFIFTAGSIRPARGLEDIFRAMHFLDKDNNASPRLVIAGVPNPNMAAYQKALKISAAKLGISGKVCWAGHLADDEMAWCYRNCRSFIMSSRVESFGQIGLEALSHGCACISADNPCLPEIFADAALYYAPKDFRSLAENVASVLRLDPGRRDAMAARARKRAGEFSWDVCAARTVAELSKAISDKQPHKGL